MGQLSGRPPRPRPNAEARAREYLTDTEVQKLMRVAGDDRNGHRDATMLLLTYLRRVELTTLCWDAIDFVRLILRRSALIADFGRSDVKW
jgi:type 1 fimbriae regulatory protein FimB/type 1 fimbriae regulatory protein FimE